MNYLSFYIWKYTSNLKASSGFNMVGTSQKKPLCSYEEHPGYLNFSFHEDMRFSWNPSLWHFKASLESTCWNATLF